MNYDASYVRKIDSGKFAINSVTLPVLLGMIRRYYKLFCIIAVSVHTCLILVKVILVLRFISSCFQGFAKILIILVVNQARVNQSMNE